jgi:hypothetical protein
MLSVIASVTVTVGLLGAIIAFMQWRTAQQKVVLDILHERFDVYKELIRIVGEFGATAKFPIKLHGEFFDAQRRARFLFGGEVDSYLDDLRRDMVTGEYYDKVAHEQNISQEKYIATFERINSAYTEFDRLFIPYMRIDQKMPLWWWSGWRSRKNNISKNSKPGQRKKRRD